MHPLTPTILKPIAGHPVQAYLDNRLQLYDVLEFILEYTGPADILVSTFSTGEEFLRRLYRLRESGRVTHATLIADLKAASKTVQLWQFMRSVFSEVFLTENHSKVLLVAGFLVTYLGYGYIMSLPDKTPEMIELFWTYNTANVACMSAAWFLLLKHVSIAAESRAGRWLANLTFCGFGIYMVHYFFVGLCYQIIHTLALPVCLRIPASALLIFIFSWSLTYIVKKVMGRKAVYLMG